MIMKKLFLLLALCLFAQHMNAQLFSKERLANLETFDNRFLTWGYFLGFNQYDFKFEYANQNTDLDTDIEVESQLGFNVGLIGDMRINRYMNLRLEPGIYFTQRNLIFPGFEEELDYTTKKTTNSADKPAELFPAEFERHCVLVSSQAALQPNQLWPKQSPGRLHAADRACI